MLHFKPFILTVCLLVLVAAFASPKIAFAQSEKQCHDYVDSLFPSREGNRVRHGEMRRDCFRAAQGQEPYGEEYWAFWIYLASEIDAGRMSVEQGRYQLVQKDNELRGRRNAQIMQILPYAIQQQQQQQQQQPYRPVVPPMQIPPTYNTNCTRDMFGNTNCITRQQ